MVILKNTIAILSVICLPGAGPFCALVAGDLAAGFRTVPLSIASAGKPGFIRISAASSGILFTNQLSREHYLTNQIYLNGSGVAAGDVDGDGRCDLYFCGLDRGNALYRNSGNWKFDEITDVAGVRLAGLNSTGAALVDVEGDGDLDLVVNTVGNGTRCLLNDGMGRFTDLTGDLPMNPGKAGMSMAFADIEGDGDLDLYVANYRTDTIRDHPNTRLQGDRDRTTGKPVVHLVNGRPTTEPDLVGRFILTERGKIIENGEVDMFYRNEGGGRFTPLAFTDGRFRDEDGQPLKEPPYDWGLTVMFRDINGDLAPDIYVCNDFGSVDRIWINDGTGKFRAIHTLALRHTSMFSMGVDCADLNRDGLDELFVADMLSRDHRKRQLQVGDLMAAVHSTGGLLDRPQYSHNTLFLNRGDGSYAEVAWLSGVQSSEWSWTPVFLDVDLDGYEDLLITSGHELEMMHADVIERAEAIKAQKKLSILEQLKLRMMFPRLDSGPLAFRNRGDLTFEDVSGAWGFDTRGVSHGMALADLDGDGDLDVVVNNLNGEAGVYRNEGSGARVGVRLKGVGPNTRGIGAKIWVYGGAVAVQSQEMICGGRYLSSDEAMRVFAAGSLTNEMRIEVKWRSGKRSVVGGVKANRIYEIDEAGAEKTPNSELRTPNSEPRPVFEDVSGLIKHTHPDEPFDDFARQPLLPRKLSQLGPGVGWYDVDGNGWEDLIIGGGKGGKLAVYRNDGKGGFERMTNSALDKVVARDQTTVLGVASGLLIGSANYEDGLTNGGCVRIYDLKRKASGESILGPSFSSGPLALGDVDGDGDLDLFVGGRVVAGRYPEAADSLLMRNEGGNLVVGQRLEKLGLVSGAVWSDLNGDGQPELILASEWGPVRIFRNESGKLVAWDAPVTLNDQPTTLNQLSGWWNGVNTGDFDNDGRLDIVVSNWGKNSAYGTSRDHPRKVYYGDFGGGGGVDVIEAYYNEEMKAEVPGRGLKAVGAALPWMREQVGSFEAYGKATLKDLYGEKLRRAGKVEVATLESVLLLNRGERYEARALPVEAQMSPAYAVCVGDNDGDGNEDLFLSQNFFAMNAENSRCDAGRGLWLRGDGRGNLRSVPGQESGVKVYGEQRGAALCDYDGDGRVDLVVTQNGAETRLYHNVGGKPGMRIRLKGSAGNPTGVGAQIRLRYGEKLGPAREIHAGSGYWSQDSAVQVMGGTEPPTQIHVRWPGGNRTMSALPENVSHVKVDPNGSVEVLK